MVSDPNVATLRVSENGEMKRLAIVALLLACQANGLEWTSYAAFETDVTNAMAHVDILMSSDFTNRLSACGRELPLTNEMASAALLTLAVSDDARSNRLPELVGETNALTRVSPLLSLPVTQRNLWQKSCAIALLATENEDPLRARSYFNSATNAIHQWDATVNCYNGGALYQSIATHFGVSELTPRQSLVFAAAHAAKMAGLLTEYTYYKNLLPSETRSFLDD